MMGEQLVAFLRNQLQDKAAVIGLSGGIDSAVVAYLLAKAITGQRVYGLIMPSSTNPPSDQADAELIASHLSITVNTLPIDPMVRCFQATSSDFSHQLAEANLKARIRMCLLYGKANAVGGLVVGTGNRSELLTGYFTKYGDGGVDLLPLGRLYKTQISQLAKQLEIPDHIIQKAPTAGLWAGQTDEAELGLTYRELDAILQVQQQGLDLSQFQPEQVERVQQLMRQARHKLATPLLPELPLV